MPAVGKTKRCVIRTDFDAETLAFCKPVLTVVNGKNTYSAGEVIRTVRARDYPTAMLNMAMLSTGLRNKFMDSYSDPTDDVGDSLTQIHEQLLAGNWAVKGEAGERTTLFIKAYASLRKMTENDARARINAVEAGDDEEAKKNLAIARAHPAIATEMARLQEEAAKARRLEAAKNVKAAEVLPTI